MRRYPKRPHRRTAWLFARNERWRPGTPIDGLPVYSHEQHHLPFPVQCCIAVAIMVVRSVMRMALQMFDRIPGLLLLLLGIFLSDLGGVWNVASAEPEGVGRHCSGVLDTRPPSQYCSPSQNAGKQ